MKARAIALLRGWAAPAVLAAVGLMSSGCNNCEKLTEKVCSDLGEDCALWKELEGPDKAIPGGRRVNRACGERMEGLPYDSILSSAKGLVVGEKIKRAAKAGDKAELERLNKEMDEVKKKTDEILAKVKEQTGR